MMHLVAGGFGWSLAWLATAALAHGGVPGPTSTPLPVGIRGVEPLPEPDLGVALGRPQPLTDLDLVTPNNIRTTGIELASYRAAPVPLPLPQGPPVPARPQPVMATQLQLARPPVSSDTPFASGDRDGRKPDGGFAIDRAPEPATPARPAVPASAPPPVSPRPRMTSAGYPVHPSTTPAPAHSPVAADSCGDSGCPIVFSCDDSCCDCSDCCEGFVCEIPMHRWWFRGEYLLWWVRSPRFPVLATTGTEASMGILGNPGTVVLFGGSTVDYDAFHGGRFTIGWWCDPCQKWGIEGSFFFLGEQSIRFAADSCRFPVLTRPFFNINENREDVQVTAAPDRATGSTVIDAPSRLLGAEINLRCNLCCGCSSRLDFLTGFRYLDLDERLTITESVLVDPDITDPLPPGVQPGDLALVVDEFETQNRFYGGQFGFDWEKGWNRWVCNVRLKVALGVTRQTITIRGSQLVTHPDGTQAAFNGGLLALPSNIGKHERSRFSVVPEVGVNIGYHLTDCLLVWTGYSFLYWSNVVRPGDQVDRVLDVSQIPNFNITPPPPAPQRRPLVPFRETGFWAQGLSVGLEYRY